MNNISAKLENMRTQVGSYAANQYPQVVGRIALRFIDDNFRNQSWEGQAWKKRKNNRKGEGRALLVLRGVLRRGNRFAGSPGAVRLYNAVTYARVHNEGFRGNVTVSGHNRRTFGKFKVHNVKSRSGRTVKTATGHTEVRSFTRKMNIPRRQFFPTADRPSPTLTKSVARQVTLDIYKILKFS